MHRRISFRAKRAIIIRFKSSSIKKLDSEEYYPSLLLEAGLLSDQDELEKIKQRKLKRLLERAEKRQAMKEKEEEVQQAKETRVKEARSYILARTLDPEASDYLAHLKTTKPDIAQQIESIIVTLVIQRRLNYVTKVYIRALERRIEGVEPSILVKRRGKEAETLSDAIRKDHD